MADLVATIAALPVPVHEKLAMLRDASLEAGGRHQGLLRWAADHPAVATGPNWCARAWWGAAAGEIVRDYLYDLNRRAAALQLVEKVDDSALVRARKDGQGLIIVTAHLGPPKFLMNWLIDQQLPLLIWTNTRDFPSWQSARGDAAFVDPRMSDGKSVILMNSAIHLRRGGILLGAADMATGERVVTIERMGYIAEFSLGLPTLARRLDVPVVIGLALWHDSRVRIQFSTLESPEPALTEHAWNVEWISRSWRVAEPLLEGSPENLRFLRWAVEQIARP